uniref:Ground-like domain-containing protein n=1 Tax=Parascaris univalens TaxID=6257 RepID=A0A915BTH4_PARUN
VTIHIMQRLLLIFAICRFTLAAIIIPRDECRSFSTPCPPSPHNAQDEKQIVKRDTKVDTGLVEEIIDEGKCNNEELRAIMLEHMRGNVREMKIAIMRAAEAKIGGHFSVICAHGDFSYITTTRLYCLESVANFNCYAFLTDFSRTKNPLLQHQSPSR